MLIYWLLGCGAEQMSQAHEIDRLRVLAVAAEPAEPRPGEMVSFSALIVSPDPVGGSAWFTCSAAASDDYGCTIDETLIEQAQSGEATVEDLQAAGFLGFLPALPPFWMVPATYLDALSEEAKLEGTFAMIFVSALPSVEAGESIDDDEIELAYKRVPVSLAATPNNNPALTGIAVDSQPLADGARLRVDAGQTYTLGALLAENARETYTYRNTDGVDEQREEEPYFTWYLQEGRFDQATTTWPYTEVLWTAPSEPAIADQSLWVVVRDRRGGMGWSEIKVSFAD